MGDDNNISEDNDRKNSGRFRRFLVRTARTVFWFFFLLGIWWFFATMIRPLPGPSWGIRKVLSLVSSGIDHVYMLVEEGHLEEAAERVRREAVEQDTSFVSLSSDAERLTEERRSRLPLLPLVDDSALRAELKSISRTPPISGKLIHILIIGIDSRLSVRDARADALHLVTINPDSAVVEFMSIPRDTYCDLGHPDTTRFNIVANAKTTNNRLLLHKVAEITKRGPVRYYMEVGFSQAMGILESLGYRDPVKTLKFLRTRRTLPGGDIQRAHNQAVFMRQNLIDRFDMLTGASGELLITAGLNFVTTNLDKNFFLGLIYSLQQKNFPYHRSDAVRLRMLPGNNIRLKEMVADSMTINRTLERIERSLGGRHTPVFDVTAFLRRVIYYARKDSARPGKVIYRLRRLNEQHAWLQIMETNTRIGIRDSLTTLLIDAYMRVGKTEQANKVRAARQAEDLLLHRAPVVSGRGNTIDTGGIGSRDSTR